MRSQPSLVYVLEDDASFLKSVVRLLRSLGFRTVATSSIAELVQNFPIEPGACLLVDIVLHGESGLEVPPLLARHQQNRPVVFMSATDDEDTLRQADTIGAVTCLHKPFEADELVGALAAAAQSAALAPPTGN